MGGAGCEWVGGRCEWVSAGCEWGGRCEWVGTGCEWVRAMCGCRYESMGRIVYV